MAARRGKSQARRNASSGLPGWAWLVLGILVTLLVVLAAPRLFRTDGSGDGFFRPRPNPDALPAAVNADGDAIAADTAQDRPPANAGGDGKPRPTQFDFYTLLPGEEVAMSDAELAASAKAEAEVAATGQQAPVRAPAGTTVLPPSIADATQPSVVAPPAAAADAGATAATAAAASSTSPAPAAAASVSEARYILQAGAFGGSGDAESVKAKIAMLGLNARVESAKIGGKTVYRVRMGPYGTASELADAKSKLASSGLPAMAVRAK